MDGRATGRRCGSDGRPQKSYDFAVRVHFVEEITTAMVSDFLIALGNARHLDPKTVNEYREILFRFFRWAIDQQGVRMPGGHLFNPVAPIKRLRRQDPAIRFLV